jgi:hypothetical protein
MIAPHQVPATVNKGRMIVKFKDKGAAVLAGLFYAQGLLAMMAVGIAIERQFDLQIPGDGYGIQVSVLADSQVQSR